MARRVGDPVALRSTLTASSLAMMAYGDPDENIALNREAMQLALDAGDKRVVMRSHLLLVNAYADKGERDSARAHARGYAVLAAEIARGAFVWVSRAIEGADVLAEGRFDEAISLLGESTDGSQSDEARGTSHGATPVLLACAAERYDDVASIERTVRSTFAPLTHELGGCIAEMLLAKLYARAGDRARTEAQLAAVREHPCFAPMREPMFLVLLVDAVCLLGDAALAERLYPLILPHAERFFGMGHLGTAWSTQYHRDLGLLAQTLGRKDDAIAHLEKALASCERLRLRGFLARMRWETACALQNRNAPRDRERAGVLIADARALADELGQKALVARIDPAPVPKRAPTMAFTMTREGEIWAFAHGGRVARLKDSRGIAMLDRLVSAPGQELHVLQLASGGDDEIDRGDAGEVLDAKAVQTYRQRLLDLREELEEAESFSDRGRADRAKKEIEFLTQELARAVGLGGRERRTANAAERARTTVQKRLKDAIRRIHDELPDLGTHLEQTIRTGAFCGYFPSGRPRGATR